jgi:hypothetical protein
VLTFPVVPRVWSKHCAEVCSIGWAWWLLNTHSITRAGIAIENKT